MSEQPEPFKEENSNHLSARQVRPAIRVTANCIIAVLGPFSSASVASRKFVMWIQDHHLEHSVVPNPARKISLTGDITFKKAGNERTFSVQGIDGGGTRRKWQGVYKFEENFLYLSYRISEGRGVEPTPPLMIQNNGERGIFYAKLRRAGPKRNKKH